MRERYKGDKRSDSLEDRAALGASSIIEEQRSREATEAEVKAKSQAEALKLKQSRDVAKKSAKFVRLDDGAIEETRRVTSDLINSLYNKSIDPRKKKALEKLKFILPRRMHLITCKQKRSGKHWANKNFWIARTCHRRIPGKRIS